MLGFVGRSRGSSRVCAINPAKASTPIEKRLGTDLRNPVLKTRTGGQSRQTVLERAEPSFVAGWAGARPAESPQTRVGSKQGEPRPKDLWVAVEALIRLSPGHREADTDSRL